MAVMLLCNTLQYPIYTLSWLEYTNWQLAKVQVKCLQAIITSKKEGSIKNYLLRINYGHRVPSGTNMPY